MLDNILKILADFSSVTATGLRGAAPAWLGAGLANHTPCCCIVPDEYLTSILEQDLSLFSDRQILLYPGQEIPPYTPLSPDNRITASRLSALYRFREGSGQLFVSSIEALLRRIMPVETLTSVAEYLLAGEECDRDNLRG